jgi:hypothetical protein
MSDPHLQNDPDRAGGLIPDGQGEFVEEEPGGAFDPRTFRSASPSSPSPSSSSPPTSSSASSSSQDEEPPMDDQRMDGPGEDIDKAHR